MATDKARGRPHPHHLSSPGVTTLTSPCPYRNTLAWGSPTGYRRPAVLPYRIATFYHPPLWGFFAMLWLLAEPLPMRNARHGVVSRAGCSG